MNEIEQLKIMLESTDKKLIAISVTHNQAMKESRQRIEQLEARVYPGR